MHPIREQCYDCLYYFIFCLISYAKKEPVIMSILKGLKNSSVYAVSAMQPVEGLGSGSGRDCVYNNRNG